MGAGSVGQVQADHIPWNSRTRRKRAGIIFGAFQSVHLASPLRLHFGYSCCSESFIIIFQLDEYEEGGKFKKGSGHLLEYSFDNSFEYFLVDFRDSH